MAVAAPDQQGQGVKVPIDVLLEDCPGDADETRLQYVLLAIQQRVPDPELVSVVISADFVGSVQDRTHDPREQAGYDVERLFGVVGAKTITSESSLEATILIPWESFNNLPEAVLYRLSAHEALHAALHQRDETLILLRLRLGLDVASAAGLWAELAGAAIDEYRIERALDDQELILEPTHCSYIPQTLVAMQQQMGDAVRRHLPGSSIEPVYHAVMGAFHRTNLLFAYAAAEELATDGKIAPEIPPEDHRRLIWDCYDQFRDTLARIPPASTATDVAELMAVGEDLALVLYEWLHHIGFDMYDRDGVGKWFEITRPAFLVEG
jgi:hypothetical protein